MQVKTNLKLNYYYSNQIYGVTRDPISKEYAIVIEFKNGGNLREVIKKNHSKLTWVNIINIFENISSGLDYVHIENYHHKDLHSGNILNSINKNTNYFSLSKFIFKYFFKTPLRQYIAL